MSDFDPLIGGIHVVDIGVIVVILGSALLAVIRGFVRELLAIVAWIGAAAVAFYAFPYARPYVGDLIGIDLVSDLVAAAGVFIVALVIFSLISASVASRMRRSRLNALDRTLGLVFGLARGALIVVVADLIFASAAPPPDQPPWVRTARSMPIIENGARRLQEAVPPQVWAWMEQALDITPAAVTGAADQGAPWYVGGEPDAEAQTERLSAPPPATQDGGGQTGYDSSERNDMNERVDGLRTRPLDSP